MGKLFFSFVLSMSDVWQVALYRIIILYNWFLGKMLSPCSICCCVGPAHSVLSWRLCSLLGACWSPVPEHMLS